MSAPAEILNAWLLHSRPFRDSSLLLEFLTLEEGRLSAVARGVRSSRNRNRASLQPFIPLQIVLSGRHELRNLRSVETSAPGSRLQGERLFAGFYLNELLVRLLPAHEQEETLFRHYAGTLARLEHGAEIEPLLRIFELQLLDSLGYGLQFEHDSESGEEIAGEYWYHLGEHGFVRQLQLPQDVAECERAGYYPGIELNRIGSGDYSRSSTRRHAKRLSRQVLQVHLGEREIASRLLFTRRRGDD